MQNLTRRRSLAILGGTVGAFMSSAPPAAAAVKTFVAFGDSYTRSFRNGVESWADQIHASGAAKVLVNLAVSGATSEGFNGARTFDRQVDIWIADHRPKGLPDRTVIYFGYNDINTGLPLSAAMNHYRIAVDRLIAQGVTQGTCRLVLCLLHDWSHNPMQTTSSRTRVRSWNQFLRSLAAERTNVRIVDLFARFDHVFKSKGKYGLINVTVADKNLAATTYLYMDGNHFGRKGHSIIAKEIRPELI